MQASFIPPVAQRERRDLTWSCSPFIQERVTLINRVQKLLEDVHIKLAAVASDMMGVSGRAMLAALLDGHRDPQALADLAKGRLRSQGDPLANALDGRIKRHYRFVLTELLGQIDSLDDPMARFDAPSHAIDGPFEAAAGLLDTIHGVARRTAEMIVAEIGTPRRHFPSVDPWALWAGVAPANYASAGQRASGKPCQGNPFWRTSLVQAGHAAARTRGTFLVLRASYRRLATRRGKQRAILAVAPSVLGIAYDMIQRQEPYHEAGAAFFDRRQPENTARRLMKRLESLGYHVAFQSPSTDVMPGHR